MTAPGPTPPAAAPARGSRRWVLAGVAALAAAAGAGVAWQRFRLEEADTSGFWGHSFPTPEGGTLALAELRGRPLLVNFWATWCPPCVREMLSLVRVYEQYKGQGFVVLGINTTYQDDRAKAAQFAQDNGVRFPVLLNIDPEVTAGYGSQHHIGTGKIGPEFTFGIIMRELLGESVLLIKDAWGGKSLMVDFRPPSAGEIADEKAKANAGKYYRLVIDHVKEVLADPKKVYPGYDAKEGFELAGFVWFQGFNDLVGSYPAVDPAKGRKGIKDYSEYSRLLACFIRDVRKDLSAPNLPFVIGVLGVGGAEAGEGTAAFRESMAAPGRMEEFKGSVTNVFTHEFWPAELDAVQAKANTIKNGFAARDKEIKDLQKNGGEWKQKLADLEAEKRKKIEETLTADELFLLDNGISNQGYHYHGSAKFFARIGQAFAEAWMGLRRGGRRN